jgi:serine/threonine protein kinase
LLKLVDFGLVKMLASEEVTLTIIQGRGTALYTPLEQYGGDAGHTDVRSDIYAFGATLYHLLAAEPPMEARERFLKPGQLVPLRDINPEISPRTERAVLWAMQLHPIDRPQSITEFRSALLGDWTPSSSAKTELPKLTLVDLVTSPVERILAFLSILLLIVSLIVTLLNF